MAVDESEVQESIEPTGLDEGQSLITSSESVLNNTGQPVRVTSTVNASVSQELTTTGRVHLDKVSVATNAASTPAAKTNNTATLTEFQIQGVSEGEKFELTAVKIGKETVEKFTAYDFLTMRRDALKAGVVLNITEAFRSFARQVQLFNERMNPDGTVNALGKILGAAGRPGQGRGHSRGQALDLTVHMNVAELAAGTLSPAFRWLTDHAAEYGFVRTVPKEPWHWEHLSGKLVAPFPEGDDYLLSLVSSEASGAAASQTGKVDGNLFLDKTVHDISKAQERSVSMTRTDRQLLYANMGREATFRGASLLGKASRYEQRTAATSTPPPVFAENSLKVVSFDFDTGLWGDGKVV